jgi:tetratricopeptide (TPR) repeat protein
LYTAFPFVTAIGSFVLHVSADEPAGPPAVTLTRAEDLFLAGDYVAAREAYAELLEENPANIHARLGLARVRLATGQYREAADGLRGLQGDSADRHVLAGELHARVGEYDEAIKSWETAIQRDVNSATARFRLGSLLESLGRRDEAIEQYRWFDRQLVDKDDLPRDASWLTDAALGFMRYSVLTRTNVAQRTKHVLHEMLQPAYERLDRTYWPARVAAGDLLRERYNNSEEDGSISDYLAALRINEHLPEAHVGLGEVALTSWNFEEAEKHAASALETNPNFAPALHLLGKKLIVERRYEEAVEAGERALAINPRDLAALSIVAAGYACRFDQEGVERIARRVSEIDPRCARLHGTLGDALGGIRQYASSEGEYLRAIDYDPTDANARTELGMMYMQWGFEDKARDALDAAWALDPFNERTKFTLDLLDMLDAFDEVKTPHFVIKYDDRKDPGLGEYLAAMLEPIHEAVTTDYGTTLAVSTIIEVFPTHRGFGVRITGKPWIHTIGACTGRVIALASPRGATDLMGPYNMASVLKHEFTHTVTLAATQNRIPHWFTEGLAVYGEDSPRNFGWMELLADAVRRGALFTLQSIDWGFMRPRKPTDRQLAYAQSEWMCEFIVDRFGYDAIQKLLARYREGKTQAQALADVLGLAPEAFDREFQAWAKDQAGRWCFDLTPREDVAELRRRVEEDPQDVALLGRLARAELDAENVEAARDTARRALTLDGENPHALEVLVQVLAAFAEQEGSAAARRAYEDEALSAARRLRHVDSDSWLGAKFEAETLLRREDLAAAVEPLKALQQLCPADPAGWRGLAGVYLNRGEERLALPQLLELARMHESDVDLRAKLARIYNRQDRLYDARYWYDQALGIDPFSVALHKAQGDIHARLGDPAAALREYKMLTRLEPQNPRHFEDAAFAAQKAGDMETAQQLARRAVELDPDSNASGLLR